ncbi:MAG: magnesium transporter [Rikenellaceae bacterium]|nr:magnesium transporter [Rikenellaceae bacterium]
MLEKEFLQLICELIENKNWKQLKCELGRLEPHEAAELISGASDHDGIIIFRLLSREVAKDTFANLELDEQETIIELLAADGRKLSELLNDLDPDDRTAFFEELPGKVSQRLMQMLSVSERETATALLGYPEGSIGRLMTPDYVAVKPRYTIKQAFDHIRRFASKSETINIIYVVDDQWNLVDALTIETLILADPDKHIEDIMDHRFIALDATDDREEAVRTFSESDRVALPVTDSSGTLLGIVTVDDMIDVVQEESTEDFQRFGALQDAIVNPLKARITTLYKQRIIWLVALVFMNVFSGAALAHYEDVIKNVVSLIFFLPLLIGSGGNAGSQSATLMIRAIAVGDVQMKDWFKLIGKEIAVSLLLGITMAAGVALIASFRAPDVILVVAITMVLIVMTGSLIGMLLPFVFTKLKLDPATASAPLITSISDITGVFIYFTVATLIL